MIRHANGRISGATVPIECTEFVGELLRGLPRDLDEIFMPEEVPGDNCKRSHGG
jgi:hypothetical protein